MKKADQSGRARAGKAGDRAPLLQEAMPETDPAYPFLAGILGVVPASQWTFARVGASGELTTIFGSKVQHKAMARAADELRRQISKNPAGPRIAATLVPIEGFESGVTLVFADERTHFGILTLLRTSDLGPFTSSEISMLTFALDALSDRLYALRLQPSPKTALVEADRIAADAVPDSLEEAFYVLDSELQIVMAWSSQDQRRVAMTGLHTRIAERLPAVLEQTVRELTAAWSSEPVKQAGVAHPVPFLVVRTQPISGPAGQFIGVRIDRFVPPNSLTGPASRFHISPREVQVLALLLDGNHLDQIAKRLFITSSTVQDHIKSMLDKTGSRNRSELIARVFGWELSPHNLPDGTVGP